VRIKLKSRLARRVLMLAVAVVIHRVSHQERQGVKGGGQSLEQDSVPVELVVKGAQMLRVMQWLRRCVSQN
jgi:hypothetical protein